MQIETARYIIENLIKNVPVKLRGTIRKGISKKSYDRLIDVLFTEYNATSITIDYSGTGYATMNASNKDEKIINFAHIEIY